MNSSAQAFMLVFTPFVALLGACFGSFLNVCVWRIPRNESVVAPRSHCPCCNRLIPWYLNIPIFSWLMLRGKCRWCGAPIAFRYILLEILTSLLFITVWLQVSSGLIMPIGLYDAWVAYDGGITAPQTYWFGLVPLVDMYLAPVYWLVVFGLLLGTFVDIEHYIIPDRVTVGGMILGLAVSPFIPALHFATSPWIALMRSGIGLVVGFGVLWLISYVGELIFKKEAMGFGDVKLMGAIGAFFGWKAVLFVLLCSSFLGSFVGIGLMLAKKRDLQGRIPFGPFLAVATLIWMFFGTTIMRWYVRLLTV